MDNLYLIGYRGSGKTTVGRLLAQRLGRSFVDADEEIVRRAGRTIAAIFAEKGEEAFRRQEADVVAALAEQTGLVVALGGGAILREENRRRIAASGHVVWLTASPEFLAARIAADANSGANRPSLTAGGGLAETERLLAEREPLYRSLAQTAVDTQGRTPDDIAKAIVKEMNHGEHEGSRK